MSGPDLISKIKAFARREYFNPDLVHAFIVTLGLVMPLAVGHYIDKPLAGGFAAVTGQTLLVIRFQHTYPQKALILFIGLIFISAAVFAGTLSGNHLWLAVLSMALLAGASSLLKEYGSYGQTIGFCAVIVFLLALLPPHSLEAGLDRYVAVWLGGLWAMFITLFFWPFQSQLPYYTNLARPWELSSELAQFLASPITRGDYSSQVQVKEISLRQAINDVLPYLRQDPIRYYFIRRDLLKLVRASSRFGATIMAMIHALENVRKHPENHLFMPALQQQLDLASLAAKHVVNALVLSRPKDLPVLEETISRLKTTTTDLEKLYDRQHLDFTVQLDLHRFISLLQSAIQYLEDGLLLLTRINQKKKLSTATLTIKRKHKLLPSWGALFRFQNVPLKHTLRLMLVTSVGIAIYQGFEIPRGYWISLTIMVVLQPDFGTTQQKSLQRVIGTFLGGVLGTLLLIHPLPSVVFILAVTIFSILFIYYQQRNYIISVTFLTMMLVAMFEVAGPIDWHIAAFRLLATVLGVILSVAAAFVLWPDWERTKVRLVMARGLRANFNLTHQIHHELLSQTGFHARIIAMRRKAESANISITESVKIVQLEPGTKKQKQKAAQNIAFYNARLTRELTSLAALLPQLKAANQTLEETDAFLMQAMSQLEETITALVSEKNTKEIISQNITFSTSALKTQLPATPAATVHNPALHIDTEVLQVEVVHEQLNKIADAIYHISKSVHFLNQY